MQPPPTGFRLKRELLGWFTTEWLFESTTGGLVYLRQPNAPELPPAQGWRFNARKKPAKLFHQLTLQIENMSPVHFHAESMLDGVVFEAWIGDSQQLSFYCPDQSPDTQITRLGSELDRVFNLASRKPWFASNLRLQLTGDARG